MARKKTTRTKKTKNNKVKGKALSRRTTRKKQGWSVLPKKKVNRNKLAKKVLVTGIILAAIILAMVLLDAGVFDEPATEKLYPLQDECSLVMGNLLHQIKDEGDCSIKCRNECQIRDKSFVRVEFALQDASCHVCDCYCK